MDRLSAMAAFVRIVDTGSLTAAAAASGSSLSSMVRTLAALEQHLGVRLLNRTTRRIHLTEEGARYLERCRLLLASVQETEAELTARRTEAQGKLTITASVLFGRRYVVPFVIRFLRRNPKVTAELMLVDRLVNVVEEGVDVAVRIGHLQDSSLVASRVGRVRRVVCASPSYLQRRGTLRRPEDVAEHSCVRHTGTNARPEFPFRVGRRAVSVPIDAVISCNDADASLQACASGLGLGMFLSYQTAPYRNARKLRYVLEEFETEAMPVQVVYPQARLATGKVRSFVDDCVGDLRQVAFD